ncbi:hypothetical protein HPB48_013040 [Haemaphysalis longicornis]|uniref:Monocarboxylate transporter n=1 Tax=Haemaphysalis longicornis TaxID=44386 RepID=A0A9J6GS17_HAELO|nr:hypothetical protein HPB48_013040 [Haemaphysalis longicornis]
MAAISSTIVDYTRDKIVDTERATLVSSILNLGILCGNLLIPFVSDTVVRSRCSVAALTCALLAVCFLVLPHVASFASVSAATFVSGLQMGYIFTLKSVLFADYLGVCSVALSWGLMGVVAVPVLFCEPSIVGK